MDLRDKTIVVTGAGRGIGRAIAVQLATHGANLALFDLNDADLAATSALCSAESTRARTYRVDVAVESEVATAMTQVRIDFGRLDGLVNNAGIVRDGLLVQVKDGAVVGRMSMDQWNAVIAVNLRGVFLCAREAGVESLAVVWAKELARYGIRCGSVAPGFTHTEILAAMRPELLDKLTAPVPLKRLGKPEEIAQAVRFIFENDFFTGRCLDVDGGLRF